MKLFPKIVIWFTVTVLFVLDGSVLLTRRRLARNEVLRGELNTSLKNFGMPTSPAASLR